MGSLPWCKKERRGTASVSDGVGVLCCGRAKVGCGAWRGIGDGWGGGANRNG